MADEKLPAGQVAACPDGGACHHWCPVTGPCFRVLYCGPFSGVYPDDWWPRTVRLAAFAQAEEVGVADGITAAIVTGQEGAGQ